MDVHRARFVAYPSSAITAVAFSRSNDAGDGPQPALKLALGRQNGLIEIWNPLHGRWAQEVVFQESEQKSIDGLAWTQEADERLADGSLAHGQYRLFSISGSPAVTEWDLQRGLPKKQSSGNFSEVWCFAAQPRAQVKQGRDGLESAPSQDIVAGCADGTLVLLSTTDQELQFKRIIARVTGKKSKCMSVTYQTRDRIVAGFTDGAIRVYDVRKDTCIRTMNLGASLPGAPKNIYVWQVKCLPNGDVVSGDSNGNITFWDARTYSSKQRITAHENDCLDIVASSDGKTLFSGSIDGRIAVIRYAPGLTGRNLWTKFSHRTIHKGDIKCMAAYDGSDMSVIVSGGSEAKAVMTPLREYGRAQSLTLPHLPQRPVVASACQARLLVSWWDKTISIWRMARKPSSELDPQPPRKLVAKMTVNSKHNLESVCISNDGRAIAAATRDEIKLFQLRRRFDADALAIRKVDLPPDFSTSSSRLLSFSPDGKWLAAVTAGNEVHIVRVVDDAAKPKRLQVLSKVVELERNNHQNESSSGFAEYERTVVRLAFSSDSAVLATADVSGYLDSWILEGNEDITAPAIDTPVRNRKAPVDDDSDSDSSDDEEEIVFFGQHWTDNPQGHLLPRLDSMPLVLTFRPAPSNALLANGHINGNPGVHATRHNPHAHSHEIPKGPHRLWVLTARHQMYEFDILAGRSSDWAQRNPTALLPANFRKLKDRAMGALWDVRPGRARLWLYGASWMFMLNVAGDLPEPTDAERDVAPLAGGKKRKGEEADGTLVVATEKAPNAGVVGKRRRLSHSTTRLPHREGLSGIARRHENGVVTEMDLDAPLKRGSRAVVGNDGVAVGEDDNDEEEDDETILAQTRLRLAARLANPGTTDLEPLRSQPDDSMERSAADMAFWHTLKYRSILGVVPLGDVSGDLVGQEISGEDDVPEVVVVERPVEMII